MGRATRIALASFALLLIFAAPSFAKPANSIIATATNVTPPDRVGRYIDVKIEGRITSTKGRSPRRCREERGVRVLNTKVYPPGVIGRKDFFPTPKSGKFGSSDLDYEYGGLPPGEDLERTGDVPYAGGTLTLEVFAPSTRIGGKRLGTIYVCKALRVTLQVPVAPAPTD